MTLYLLRPIDDSNPQWDTDCMYGFVIRANREHDARHLAGGHAGDEGMDVWLDDSLTYCEVITKFGKHGVILSDFNAG